MHWGRQGLPWDDGFAKEEGKPSFLCFSGIYTGMSKIGWSQAAGERSRAWLAVFMRLRVSALIN